MLALMHWRERPCFRRIFMLLALALFCALIESVFTLLEVALGAVSRASLRALADKDESEATPRVQKQATQALRALERPDRLTILFVTVTSLSLWTAATCLAWEAQNRSWPFWQLGLALIGVLFVAEVLPLLIAARYAEAIALRGAHFVRRVDRFLTPLTWLLGFVGRVLARLLGARFDAPHQVTGEELKTALQTAEEEGVIASDERAMLEGAMDLRDKRLREVMTPRVKIVGLPAAMPLRESLKVGLDSGHSRLPVYEGTLDHVVGILALKDVLPHLRQTPAAPLCARDIARPAPVLPSSKTIASALDELRRQRTLMAMVLDENGGTAGLVTIEDLLEEIVGEIQDEYDAPVVDWRVEGETLVCEPSVPLREVARAWHETWDETLQLRTGAGSAVETGMTIGEFALRLKSLSNAALELLAAGNSVADDDAITPVMLQIVQYVPPTSNQTITGDETSLSLESSRITAIIVRKSAPLEVASTTTEPTEG